MLVFLTGEHSNNNKMSISVHYFSSSRFMPILIVVEKVVLLVCIKSVLIITFPARTINKTPLDLNQWTIKTSQPSPTIELALLFTDNTMILKFSYHF